MEHNDIYIYGKHAVLEALRAPQRPLREVFLASTRTDDPLRQELKTAGVRTSLLDFSKLGGEVDRESAHQGIVGVLSLKKVVLAYEDFISRLTITPNTALVVLGEVQDPHNVGAIIRSAAALGLSGVLIPEHNQAQVNGTVVKASSGMAFQIPLVSIGNVNTTLRDLKERGFWIYGLLGEAKQSIDDEVFTEPSVFVVGNEGEGIRAKTKDACDVLLSIPMHPRCESLNVSVSAALAFHAWAVSHPQALINQGPAKASSTSFT